MIPIDLDQTLRSNKKNNRASSKSIYESVYNLFYIDKDYEMLSMSSELFCNRFPVYTFYRMHRSFKTSSQSSALTVGNWGHTNPSKMILDRFSHNLVSCVKNRQPRYYSFMPEGKYKFNKQYTAEQMEMDDTYGILQTETREITFTALNNFKYTYHYFYQYENSSYKMEDDIRNDTVVSGTYLMDGNRLVASITHGEQVARDHVKKKNLGSKKHIAGTITFEEAEGKLKVLDFQLTPKEMHKIESQQTISLVHTKYLMVQYQVK